MSKEKEQLEEYLGSLASRISEQEKKTKMYGKHQSWYYTFIQKWKFKWLYGLKKQIKELKEEIEKVRWIGIESEPIKNIKEMLQEFRKTMKRFFTIIPTEWEEWMDKTYFIERLEKLDGKESKEDILGKARIERFKLGMSEEEYNKYIGYTNLNYDWQRKYKEIINIEAKDGKKTVSGNVDRNSIASEKLRTETDLKPSKCTECKEYPCTPGYCDGYEMFERKDGDSNIKVTISRNEGEGDDISKDVISSEGKESPNPERRKDGEKSSKKHKYIYQEWKGFITPIPKSQAQREAENPEEPWECPICHKTVYIGYTVHRYCLDDKIVVQRQHLKNWKRSIEDYMNQSNRWTWGFKELVADIKKYLTDTGEKEEEDDDK